MMPRLLAWESHLENYRVRRMILAFSFVHFWPDTSKWYDTLLLIAMAHKGRDSHVGLWTSVSGVKKHSPHPQIILNNFHLGRITELIHDINNIKKQKTALEPYPNRSFFLWWCRRPLRNWSASGCSCMWVVVPSVFWPSRWICRGSRGNGPYCLFSSITIHGWLILETLLPTVICRYSLLPHSPWWGCCQYPWREEAAISFFGSLCCCLISFSLKYTIYLES